MEEQAKYEVAREGLKKYIGCKMIEAKSMTRGEYNNFKGWEIPHDENPDDEGYLVKYSDSYLSWSPKDVFEKAYMQVGDNCTITQENVDNFIDHYKIHTLGEKTTVVEITLVNGFVMIESSSCVDPANYDEELGAKICLENAKNRIWNLLGFLLQTAKGGIR